MKKESNTKKLNVMFKKKFTLMATEWFELIPAQTKGVCSDLMIVHVSATKMGDNTMSHMMRPIKV